MKSFCTKCIKNLDRKEWKCNDLCNTCFVLLDEILDVKITSAIKKVIQPERSKREDIQKECEHCTLCPDFIHEGQCCRAHLHE